MGYLHHLVGIEVEAYHCIVAFGVLGLLLDGEAVTIPVEFGYSISLRVIDPVSKYSGLIFLLGSLYGIFQDFGETCTVEDVVTEYETGGVFAYEVLADDEGLGESIGGGLFGVAEADSVVAAVTEEALEAGEVLRGRDDEYVAYSGKHEGRDGIIDHRLVEDGEELFAYALGNRI